MNPSRMQKVIRYCFALFTLEIGLFLLIFPWTESWLLSELQDAHPLLQMWWNNPFVRTGLSGLGAINVYLAIHEFLHTLRNR